MYVSPDGFVQKAMFSHTDRPEALADQEGQNDQIETQNFPHGPVSFFYVQMLLFWPVSYTGSCGHRLWDALGRPQLLQESNES